ncbi:hypothetical protein JCM3765_007557 [Sporobolomyces pararoseus]
MTKNVLLSTTLSLVALQLGSRLFSFGLNQLLVRSTTPAAFGVATIQFDTLRDTVLFLLREGIRGAVIRTRSSSTPTDLQKQSRLIPVLLSPLVLPIFYTFHFLTSSSSSPPTSYTLTLALYALSTIIELLSEPSYLITLSSWETLTSTRVRIEGLAVVTKALTTLLALNSLDQTKALEAYGWGQLVYSLTLFIGLEYSTRKNSNDKNWKLKARKSDDKMNNGSYFDKEIKTVGWALTKQSIVKQVLTEGDKLAVSKFGNSQDLGTYAVALNYGSLVARIIFQPLEESSRLYFSSLSPSISSSSTSTPPLVRLEALHKISLHLSNLLNFYTHFSLILIFLLPPYISPLLTILLGTEWSKTSSSTLKFYLNLLPFLAFNGLLESGFQSFANQKWLKLGSYWFGVCTLGFASTVFYTMGNREDGDSWGSKGLIVGNCVNMGMRILFSGFFLKTFLEDKLKEIQVELEVERRGGKSKEEKEKEEELKKVIEIEKKRIWEVIKIWNWIPSVITIFTFYLGGKICRASEENWLEQQQQLLLQGGGISRKVLLKSLTIHFGIGALVGLSCLGVM